MLEQLAQRVNENSALIRRGRFVTTSFLFDVGTTQWLISIDAGRISSVAKGPFVMPNWTFAVRAPADAWAKFWEQTPEPGFHDIMALMKQHILTVEGNLHPFMSNLFYFKGVLASLRKEGSHER